VKQLRWPLMKNQFTAADFDAVYNLLSPDGMDWNLDAQMTMGEHVEAFEREFAVWQDCKHAVMTNSGSSANLVTMAALAERTGLWQDKWATSAVGPKIIVPAVTWSSDITSVMHTGFEPVFVDVDRQTLGMNPRAVIDSLNQQPTAVFLTHCMGFSALDYEMYGVLARATNTVLIEDCCESIGARTRWAGRKHKVGNFGLASNFSFYFAHHLTTIEGGMVTTDDADFADTCRMLRNHGLTRGLGAGCQPVEDMDIDPNFTFAVPGFNVRPQEINAAIGRSQLKRLDANIEQRRKNAAVWYGALDGDKYQTDFDLVTSSPYGLLLILREPNGKLRDRVEHTFREHQVEYRRGVAGGGNMLRQPYLRRIYGDAYKQYPVVEHLHHYGYCIGGWPGLPQEWIESLATDLNKL
jgi:CDP-4-dehydro-6-deoxyglucose reductase, E1